MISIYELDLDCEFKSFDILTYELNPTWCPTLIPLFSTKPPKVKILGEIKDEKDKFKVKKDYRPLWISLVISTFLMSIPIFLHYYFGMSW